MPTYMGLTIVEQRENMLAGQRVDCRCGFCGELLGEDVTIKESAALIRKHRREAHPELLEEQSSQQRGNARRANAASQRVLDALDNEFRPVKEISQRCGQAESTVWKHLKRFAADGRIERSEQRIQGTTRGTPIALFRLAA